MRRFVFYLCFALVFPAAGTQLTINFGDFSEDHPLTNDFRSALAGGGQLGDWKVVEDAVPSAFAPLSSNAPAFMNHISVLAQLDQDPAENRFPMLIYNKESFKDFQMKMRFKIVNGVQERMAGIVFRYQNPSNFYVIRASALGHNVRFYKYINGQFVDPTTINADVLPGSWHTLTVQCEGNQINCWLDDQLVMPLTSVPTFASGKVGFWTMSDSLTYFGNTSIIYKPEIPMAQLLVQNILDEEPRILGLRVYTLDKSGTPHVVASKQSTEIGMAGTDAETGAITNGAIYFGRGRGTVAVTMPLNDRNGDPVAAVRIQLKSFIGESRDDALARARMVVDRMQQQILSRQDLLQ